MFAPHAGWTTCTLSARIFEQSRPLSWNPWVSWHVNASELTLRRMNCWLHACKQNGWHAICQDSNYIPITISLTMLQKNLWAGHSQNIFEIMSLSPTSRRRWWAEPVFFSTGFAGLFCQKTTRAWVTMSDYPSPKSFSPRIRQRT